METLKLQQEVNPGMDIIPDLDLREDEQMQSQSLGDTKILKEHIHIEKDMKETLHSQQHEQREGQGFVTQELVALHPTVKAAADNQVDKEIKIQEEVALQEPTSSQSAAKISMREPQKEDTITQELASPRVVDVVAKESPEKVAVT